MTTRWTRSPRGRLFGVYTGLAEWRDLDPQATRLIAGLISLFTMPASIIVYLIAALILPMQRPEDVMGPSSSERSRAWQDGGSWTNPGSRNAQRKHTGPVDCEDAKWEDKSNEDLRREYEDLKKKVESMENEMFDREKDWDERFREGQD